MKNTTVKRVSKKMQNFVAYNPKFIYYSLLRKLFLKECIDYYSDEDTQYTEKDVLEPITIFEIDDHPPLFNDYILDNHKHVMYFDKQAKGYNYYIQIDYYEEIEEINEDGDTIVNYQQLGDKLQCFVYQSKTGEFVEITENEYNNYLKLNEISYSKRKNKTPIWCTYYTDYMIPNKTKNRK
ncbi:MAG: hypothetical protein EOM29_10155 [Bacteroidia bacterium]|nr:hypothetical protein [Bacteroidia bacterium]